MLLRTATSTMTCIVVLWRSVHKFQRSLPRRQQHHWTTRLVKHSMLGQSLVNHRICFRVIPRFVTSAVGLVAMYVMIPGNASFFDPRYQFAARQHPFERRAGRGAHYMPLIAPDSTWAVSQSQTVLPTWSRTQDHITLVLEECNNLGLWSFPSIFLLWLILITMWLYWCETLTKPSTCKAADCIYRSCGINAKSMLDKHTHIWVQVLRLLNKQRKHMRVFNELMMN